MAMLGLDPRQQQEQQRAAITAQSQRWEDELTKTLRQHAFGEQQPFTSPWQVAGQMAQALSGRMHAGQNAQNYAALNEALSPGGGEPTPSAPQAFPAPALGGNSPVPADAAGGPPPAPAASPASPGGNPETTLMPTHYQPGTHKYTPFSPEIKQAIFEGAQLAGVDPEMLAEFAHFESDGDPNAHKRGSQYKGLMQLNDEEMAKYSGGQGNIWNPRDSARVAGLIAKDNMPRFQKFSGRDPSFFDLYMMHQQGPAGYMQHVAQPDRSAIENMAAVGERHAHDAITGNGGSVHDTSGQFLQRWRNKYQQVQLGDFAPGAQGAPTQVASLTGAPGASGAPAPSPAGPQGTQVVQAGGAPGQFGMEQIPLPPEMLASMPHRPQPQYTVQQLQQIRRMYGANAPIDTDKAWQEIQQANQPIELDVPGGKLSIAPGSKTGTYKPTIQTKDIDVNGVKVPVQFYIDSRNQQHIISGVPRTQGAGAPNAAAAAQPAGAAPGQDEPFPESGNVADIAAWAERRATRMAGEKTSAEENAKIEPEIKKAVGIEAGKAPIDVKKDIAIAEGKVGPNIRQKAGEVRAQGQEQDWNAEHRGFTGMGTNFASQAPTLRTLADLAPKAFTGAGTDAMLALNRWADKIGLTYKSAKPREMFDQLATKVLGDQFASMRNASSEEGQQASRIFAAMLKVEEQSNLTANDSLAGTLAKIKRMQRVASKGMEFADRADRYVRDKGQLDPDFMIQMRRDMADADYDQEEPEPWQIEKLKSDPTLREKFDEKFGKGAAEKALGAR